MKILLRLSDQYDSFFLSLPFVQELGKFYSSSSVIVVGNKCTEEFGVLIPFIDRYMTEEECLSQKDFDLELDLTNPKAPVSNLNLCKRKTYNGDKNLADYLLDLLPKMVRPCHLVLRESLKGIRYVRNLQGQNFDFIFCLFNNEGQMIWSEEEVCLFVDYFTKMTGKTILFLAPHEKSRELKSFVEGHYQDLESVKWSACSSVEAYSLIKRAAYVMTQDSKWKHLITNPETVHIDVHMNEFSRALVETEAYRGRSYILKFKDRLNDYVANKFVFSNEELAIKSKAQFISYLVSTILDEDEEKLRWFSETYESCFDLFLTKISKFGYRQIPCLWNQNTLEGYMNSCVGVLEGISDQDRDYLHEIFLDDIFQGSDFTYDHICYYLMEFKNKLTKSIDRTKRETAQFRAPLYEASGEVCASFSSETIRGGQISEQKDLGEQIMIEGFIRQVIFLIQQKVLESLPMTGTYYS